jgi:uncharacterized protein
MIDKAMQPVQLHERIHLIDILRGFALLGILLVNMHLFSNPIYTILMSPTTPPPFIDRIAEWFIRFAAEGKFYSLFSLLFGLGLTIQMSRAQARGSRFVPTYLRRLFFLLLIGLVHAFLIWTGDILIMYALLGVLLIFFRNARPRTLLIWVGVILGLFMLLNVAGTVLFELASSLPESAAQIEQATAEQQAMFRAEEQRAYEVYTHGTFAEITRHRIQEYLGFVVFAGPSMAPGILAMFLIGVYFGRRRLFEDVEANLPFFRKLFWWGLVIGVPLNLIYASLMPNISRAELNYATMAATLSQIVGAPALSLSYVAGLSLLLRKPVWQQRLRPLAATGQMALTNYLGQSLIATFIFYGYGLAFFGRAGWAAGLLLTVAIYILQVTVSNWWALRFRFGPAEWLWRSLTYMKPQPFRRHGGRVQPA